MKASKLSPTMGDVPQATQRAAPPASRAKDTVNNADDPTLDLTPSPATPAVEPGALPTGQPHDADADADDGNAGTVAFLAETTDGRLRNSSTKPAKSKRTRDLPYKEVGPYRIIELLGRGGMGVVYKARHKELHREVALKMILGATRDDDTLSRFQLEAQSIAALKHPGIVQIYEYGNERGVPWFSLEYVEGKTLAHLTKGEPLEPHRAARFIADLAAAVAYAHEHGVLHRDIKPANVLVAAGDLPKLTDFGLAKRAPIEDVPADAANADASNHRTIDGQVLGTPNYMPPEQARGDHAAIGPLSDQYSLGATLYYLLTGRAPFVGASAIELVMQVISREPLTVRQLQPGTPLDLETICLKAMSKEPSRRYAHCTDLEADLRRFLRYEPIVARPIGTVERAWRWCRRNPKFAIPVATAVVAVLTTLTVSLWSAVTLAQKNVAIEEQIIAVVEAKKISDQNAELAYDRAVQAKNSISAMLFAIRNAIPSSEAKLKPVREQLLRIASDQLDQLPDESSDDRLTTGLEKARVLEERYLTALELGEPSKAIQFLDAAEEIVRKRNAAQATDQTRLNLSAVLYSQSNARASAQRDMEQVRLFGEESLRLLDDVLVRPHPSSFDAENGSVPQIDTLTQLMIHGYQHALTLKKLGRVYDGFDVIEQAVNRFDPAMEILRSGPFRQLSEDQWLQQKKTFRGMISDQVQLRAVLLASVGRDQEAAVEQQQILANVRRLVEEDTSLGKLESRAKLSLALTFAGDLARQRGQRDDALVLYQESVDINRELYDENPALSDRRNRFHVSLMRLGGLLRSRDLSRAQEHYAAARRIAEDMVLADPQSTATLVALALVSPFSGPPHKAAELADEILAGLSKCDAELAVDMARVFSASAESESLSSSPDREAITGWQQRALELLGNAIAAGYRDQAYLAGEPDLDAVRPLPEFKRLLEELRASVGSNDSKAL
ncbi:MAG: serine/threonine-protein kinase [Aureliella sp.]